MKHIDIEVQDKYNPIKIHVFRFGADKYISYNQLIKGNPFYTCWTRVYRQGFAYSEYLTTAIAKYKKQNKIEKV